MCDGVRSVRVLAAVSSAGGHLQAQLLVVASHGGTSGEGDGPLAMPISEKPGDVGEVRIAHLGLSASV